MVPFEVLDPDGQAVPAISGFLRDFVARGNRSGSVRSYAYGLLRWWRFLLAAGAEWDKATPAHGREFVLWLRQATKPMSARRTVSAGQVGAVNAVTRKQHLGDEYAPRTIRHANAIVRAFYTYWMEEGAGPLVNPMPLARARSGRRPNAHLNPLELPRAEGRLRYNPPLPKTKPRSIPDQLWDGLFTAMGHDRDRAILALAISTAARASELLGMRPGDIDWGEQLIRVRRKGSDSQQWLPASPDAFVWLRLYLAKLPDLDLSGPLWWTLRPRGGHRRVLDYDALRAVLRRANRALGTNWTMHDLRHTCALRMVRDTNLSLRDVQTILGHAHLATTQQYLLEDDDAVISRVRQHHADRQNPPPAPPPPIVSGYASADLAVLFGASPR